MRKAILPLFALGMLSFALLHVARAQRTIPQTEPPVDPARNPYGKGVAGAGIVEPKSENISVGSILPGVVTRVLVEVGDDVEVGSPLFQLDKRALQADLAARRAAVAAAQAQLKRLDNQPRSEELPVSAARVREAEVNLADSLELARRARDLANRDAFDREELVRREQAARRAQEQLRRARAEDDLLRAGAWEFDKEVARAQLAQANAQLEQVQTDLDRLVVRSPIRGKVLQVNVRPGEYVGTPPSQALVMLGDVSHLHVRVDVDENDIPRFRAGATARAILRGEPRQEYPLRFVRIEPYVVPKRSLTGDSVERVDTRVLQVIYRIDADSPAVHIGQQVDVYVDETTR